MVVALFGHERTLRASLLTVVAHELLIFYVLSQRFLRRPVVYLRATDYFICGLTTTQSTAILDHAHNLPNGLKLFFLYNLLVSSQPLAVKMSGGPFKVIKVLRR